MEVHAILKFLIVVALILFHPLILYVLCVIYGTIGFYEEQLYFLSRRGRAGNIAAILLSIIIGIPLS